MLDPILELALLRLEIVIGAADGTDFGAHLEVDGDGDDDLVWQIEPRVRGFEAPTYAARQLLRKAAGSVNDRFGLNFEAKLAPFHLSDADVAEGKK